MTALVREPPQVHRRGVRRSVQLHAMGPVSTSEHASVRVCAAWITSRKRRPFTKVARRSVPCDPTTRGMSPARRAGALRIARDLRSTRRQLDSHHWSPRSKSCARQNASTSALRTSARCSGDAREVVLVALALAGAAPRGAARRRAVPHRARPVVEAAGAHERCARARSGAPVCRARAVVREESPLCDELSSKGLRRDAVSKPTSRKPSGLPCRVRSTRAHHRRSISERAELSSCSSPVLARTPRTRPAGACRASSTRRSMSADVASRDVDHCGSRRWEGSRRTSVASGRGAPRVPRRVRVKVVAVGPARARREAPLHRRRVDLAMRGPRGAALVAAVAHALDAAAGKAAVGAAHRAIPPCGRDRVNKVRGVLRDLADPQPLFGYPGTRPSLVETGLGAVADASVRAGEGTLARVARPRASGRNPRVSRRLPPQPSISARASRSVLRGVEGVEQRGRAVKTCHQRGVSGLARNDARDAPVVVRGSPCAMPSPPAAGRYDPRPGVAASHSARRRALSRQRPSLPSLPREPCPRP